MFGCVRQVKIPFIQPYLPLKCMSLRTQSYPKVLHCSEELPPLQCESVRNPPAPETLQDTCLWNKSLPFNAISALKITEFVECSHQFSSSSQSSIQCRTKNHRRSCIDIDSLNEASDFSTRSLDNTRHNLVTFSESDVNSLSLVNYTNQYQQLSPNLNIVSTEKSGVLHYFSGNKPNEKNVSGGRPSEDQLLKIQEGLVKCLPRFFIQSHDYSLYNQNLVFHNNISGVTTRGVIAYAKHLSMVRILAMLKYTNVVMHVLKVTNHPEDGTVRVRWRVSGVPGFKALFMFWKFRPSTVKDFKEAEWTDGFSIFHIGSDGLIFKHVCDKMMPDDNVEKLVPGSLGVKFAAGLGFLSNGGGCLPV